MKKVFFSGLSMVCFDTNLLAGFTGIKDYYTGVKLVPVGHEKASKVISICSMTTLKLLTGFHPESSFEFKILLIFNQNRNCAAHLQNFKTPIFMQQTLQPVCCCQHELSTEVIQKLFTHLALRTTTTLKYHQTV